MGTAATAYVTSATQQRPIMLVDGKDRRRRRRLVLAPMYTTVVVRVLSRQTPPLDGHVIDLSETGIAVELDEKIKPGSAVTVEFSVSGLGRTRNGTWPTFAAAAEVLRLDNLEDFPGGPYKTALRFIRLPSIVQAQIARYVISHPAATVGA